MSNRNKKQDCKYPLVTIVTVVYNLIKSERKKFFKQCLKSVHDQTYENIEHIIVDGASNDGTLDLIKQYSDKGWIKYISEPDNGIYDAMNKGIKMAHGKYIALLNSDDFYHNKQGIEKTVESLEKHNADFSYANAISQCESGDVIFKGDISTFLYDMPFAHLTMFTKKDVLMKENCFDEKYGLPADYDLIIRLILKDYKSVYINDEIATYRPGGATTQNINDYSDDIKNIYYDNYSTFYNFLDAKQTKDIKYKKEIPVDFAERFEQYASGKYRNLNIENIMQTMSNLKQQNVREFSGNYSVDCDLELSLGDKKLSKEKYERYVDNVNVYNKRNNRSLVSVIIVAYNEKDDLLRNLDHFKNQTNDEYEIFVVDNGLSDDVKIRLKQYEITHIILNKNTGPSAGRNIGACYANSDLLAFIDVDGYVNECYIESAIEIMKNESKIAVRGKVLPIKCSTINPPQLYDLGNEQIPFLPTTEGNLIMRKNDYVKVGGMEDVLFGHEGIVMAYRMLEFYDYSKESFYYDPRLVLYHDFQKSGDKNKKKDEKYKILHEQIIKVYPNFSDVVGDFLKSKNTLVELQRKEEQIQKLKQKCEGADDKLMQNNIKNSKSFRLGDLFFRSVKKPYKLITYPYNFIKILLK